MSNIVEKISSDEDSEAWDNSGNKYLLELLDRAESHLENIEEAESQQSETD